MTMLLPWLFALLTVALADQVCYQPFGCFQSDGKEIKTPQTPDVVNTHFKVFNRQHQTTPYYNLGGSNWLGSMNKLDSHLDPSKKTKILVHGFLGNGDNDWIRDTTKALLKKGDFNIIVVDWRGGSQWPYEQAAGNSILVGEELAVLLSYIHSSGHINYADVHIIGHSLGAQIAAQAGESTLGKIGRITALDPADPGFSGKALDKRLDKSDALFVDVIHSDGSHFNLLSGFGTKDAVGDIDFYPNGGEHQPGCSEKPVGSALNGILHGSFGNAVDSFSCSHSRAHQYFLESLTSSCKFYGHQCASTSDFSAGKCLGCPAHGCPVMGYDADQTQARGSFYLATSTSAPFCGKEYYVEVHVSHALHTTYGELFVTLIGTRGTSEELKFSKLLRYYHRDDVEKNVISTHKDIGVVSQVKVRFVRGHDLHALGAAHEILIGKVLVESTENPNVQVKICGHDAHIHERNTITLSSHTGC
ncbi:hypothetical protein FSP39_010814 [Pinctada imbricata]|uniref:Lipase domain-containing protein n=1 Tax=Pinctada imbricata TaxID=66713 RepID=A0AA89C165_PINIB|nr:hypothetical protein FSP39_010814 [Pinctada imbricata]